MIFEHVRLARCHLTIRPLEGVPMGWSAMEWKTSIAVDIFLRH